MDTNSIPNGREGGGRDDKTRKTGALVVAVDTGNVLLSKFFVESHRARDFVEDCCSLGISDAGSDGPGYLAFQYLIGAESIWDRPDGAERIRSAVRQLLERTPGKESIRDEESLGRSDIVLSWALKTEEIERIVGLKPGTLMVAETLKKLFASLPKANQERCQAVRELTHMFRQELIEFLEPAFREALQTRPPENLKDRMALMKELNEILGELGLAIRHPTTGEPCSLMGDQYRIRLQAKDRRTSASSSVTEIEPLQLMEAPRREGRSSRLRPKS